MAKRIDLKQRMQIEKNLELGKSIPEIAKLVGRHKSSIYNEVSQNTDPSFKFYCALRAETLSKQRQSIAVRKKPIMANLPVKASIEFNEQLKARSNPKQIANVLRNEFNITIGQQTIYRHIWDDRLKGGKLYTYLRRKGRRLNNKSITVKVKVSNKKSIELRPKRLLLMMTAGHWEIDTIYGLNQKSYLLTMVDIATMYTIIVKLPNKEAATVERAISSIIANSLLPFLSITSDNGTEFANHANITLKYKIDWYFCHPYCSGERGLNENTNGLIRDFYPKRTDFRAISDEGIRKVQNTLNTRPRERIGFSRPAHAMATHLMAA